MSITLEPEHTVVTKEELERWPTLPARPVYPRYPSIDEKVAKEAERLDRLFPGWENRVNIDTLDIAGHWCILEQVAYKKTLLRRRHVSIGFYKGLDLVKDDAYARGVPEFSAAYYSNQTRDAWIDEIKRRRA